MEIVTDLILGLICSSIGIVGALLLAWLQFTETVIFSLSPFSSINFLVVTGLLIMYNSSFSKNSIGSVVIYCIIAFLYHIGRITEYLEKEDKRFRILFLSFGYTKKEYVGMYLFRKSTHRNLSSLLSCWGLLTTGLVLSDFYANASGKLILGGLLIILGFTSALLDRKE
ncbi:hypothetical protein [Pseudothermotoga thermarum]|uniref:Uncharacterized protein n=1 Tax=Pseudothermotoga thermarum DSM 5069 TaxID=688269 RepID=F7YX89_9THEM|nr:hypothetical protein [Pseudothermotoga thermarum]AEH51273.1 hypothetical protein Theth_1201 [Pseudothermotoga thermarum DSM 5069]